MKFNIKKCKAVPGGTNNNF